MANRSIHIFIPGTADTAGTATANINMYIYQINALNLHMAMHFSFGRGSFLALSAAGHAEGPRIYSKAQAWAPAGLRGALTGRSKSRGAGSFRGITFRRDRAKQDDGNPHKINDHRRSSHVLLCITARISGAATLQQQPRFNLCPLCSTSGDSVRVCPCVPSDLPGYMIGC